MTNLKLKSTPFDPTVSPHLLCKLLYCIAIVISQSKLHKL